MVDVTLLHIARKTGLFGTVSTSTVELSKKLKLSQQTISRRLRELEKNGFIKRNVSPAGIRISLADKGRHVLKEELSLLKKLFEKKNSLKGIIFSGVGEGSYYVRAYQTMLKKFLGKKPYFGTLNMKTDPVGIKEFLASIPKIRMKGFSTKERSYGPVDYYPISIKGTKAAIIIPKRTGHKDNTVEIISQFDLRKKFKLEDNSKFEVSR